VTPTDQGDGQDGAVAEVRSELVTGQERERFDEDGFLLVPGALDAGTTAELLGVALEADTRFRAEPEVTPFHVLNRHDLVAGDERWLPLVDWPATFPIVCGLLGWNIQLFHTQLLVTPPAPAGSPTGAYGWHQDNNRMNLDLDLGGGVQPMISVKVGYFLTDLPDDDMGNLHVVPGSHRRGRPEVPVGAQPPGAVAVTARAGDAIVFDRRLWHAASTNCSRHTRVFATFGYAHRWVRPKSAMQHGALAGRVDPVRRQLLGWASSANGWFDPTDEDVPLRAWIRQRWGDGAVAR
jgi:ectoine hydroxylase-related dioxygenase (phytanoyl-CoA dioxygenase family)